MSHTNKHTAAPENDILSRIRHAIDVHPPMPAMIGELLKHANDPHIDFKELAEIVRFDPGITMNVLKVANSAAYIGAQPVDSLQQAFVRIGAKKLFRIIIAQEVATQLAGKLRGYDLEPRMLLKHSIGAALIAEALALHLGRHPKEVLFTAGLLHDMGKVVLDPFVFEYRKDFVAALCDTEKSFDQIERDILGVTHPQAGAWLMEKWAFPQELIAIVLQHHHPENAEAYQDAALMIHLADTLVYSIGVGDGIDGLRYKVAADAAGILGLQSKHIEQIASNTWEKLNEWNDII